MGSDREASFSQWVEYGLYLVAMAGIRAVPLPIAQGVAAFLGRMVWAMGGRRVAFAMGNLRLAYPDRSERELRDLGRESFIHLAWNLVDLARAVRWDADDLLQRVSVSGVEHVRAATAHGRGAFVLTLHQGMFELALRVAPLVGFPITVIGRPLRNPIVRRFMDRERTRTGSEWVEHRNAAPGMLRALRRGRLVAVLNDQYSKRSRGVMVPLFGKRCSTSVGVATLALRSGAPVVPAHIWRDGPDHHQLAFLPAMPAPEPSGDRRCDVELATAAYNEAIEQMIRAHPEQWMWSHRRFRYSPDLDEDPYAGA